MSLIPYTITALERDVADSGASGKNIIVGATCSMFIQPANTAALLYEDAAGSNSSTAKTTGADGQVVVYVNAGTYVISINGVAGSRVDVDQIRADLSDVGGAALVKASSGNTVQAEINALSAGQIGGVIVFTTYALLNAYTPSNAAEQVTSYKVTNDPDSTLNGDYHWISGTTYAKDAGVVQDVINKLNSSEGVSGFAVENYTSVRTDLAFSNVVDLTIIIADFYLKSDGTTTAFSGAGYTNRIYVYGNAVRTIKYSGRYGNQAIGILFRDVDDAIISSTSQGSIADYIESVAIPSNAYYMQISTTQTSTLEVNYIETNITQLDADLSLSTSKLNDGSIDLTSVARSNGVYLNASNALVSLTDARTYNAIPVIAGRIIRYDAKFGSSAVAMLFLDNLDGVISSQGQASNTFAQGFTTVPATAVSVRFSSTDVSDVDPVFSYVNENKANYALSGKSFDAIGDSLIQGSSIRSNEGYGVEEAERAVWCGLIGSRNGMKVINNGIGGTRVAAFNPYGRTVGYYDSGVLIGYEEIHYLAANTGADGKIFTTPAGCDSVKLTIAFTDSSDTNNSISDLSATLKMVLGDDLTGTNLYASGNNVTGSYIKYDGSLIADATGIYVDIPVSASTQYAISDLYAFAVIGTARYNSFVERKADFVANQTDFKLIMGGTNDRNDYVIGANNSLSPYEFKGAYNIIIKNILDTFPQTRLGLATIMRFNTETYIDELAQATIDIGDLWSVPVIDMRKNSGINVTLVTSIAATNYDSIHPNLAGNITLSYKLESFLSSI
jgi:hypothetical protein